MVKKYLVKLEITNDVWVEATSPKQAENKVLDLIEGASPRDGLTASTLFFSILDGAKHKANVDIFSEKEVV